MSMEILTTALEAVLPIVLLILLGYFLKGRGLFTESFLVTGNKVVFRVCLPVMLFINVYRVESFAQIPWDIILYCVVVVLVIFALGLLTALAVTPIPQRRGVLLQCTFRSNFAIIGLPLAASLGGDAGVALASILSAVTIPVFNILAVISLSVFADEGTKKPDGKKILTDIAKNPLIIGVLLGIVSLVLREVQLARWGTLLFSLERDLPSVFSVMNSIKGITTPFALMMLGGQFRFSAVKGLLKEIVTGTLWRTVAAPLIGIGGAWLLSTYTPLLRCGMAEYPALIALFGSPVAISSAIMAREMKGDEQLATQLVVWTSVVSIVTIFLTACLMMRWGLLAV